MGKTALAFLCDEIHGISKTRPCFMAMFLLKPIGY
jgi:hypothetical protein